MNVRWLMVVHRVWCVFKYLQYLICRFISLCFVYIKTTTNINLLLLSTKGRGISSCLAMFNVNRVAVLILSRVKIVFKSDRSKKKRQMPIFWPSVVSVSWNFLKVTKKKSNIQHTILSLSQLNNIDIKSCL